MMGYQVSESYFLSHDGKNIYRKSWVKPDTKALIVIAHGLGEHCDRYQNLINYLENRSFSFYALDHRGHGRSQGQRGHVSKFRNYSHDLDALIKSARAEHPLIPLILLGHSLGGVIAYHYATHFPNDLDGLILSSAALISKTNVPRWKTRMASILNIFAPSRLISSGLDANGLSHDPKVIQAYLEDPLVHDKVSSRWFLEFNRASKACLRRGDMLRMPLLIIHGADDPITDPHGSQLILERANSKDKELHIFPGMYHETMNEPEAQRKLVLKCIGDWLDARFDRGKPEQMSLDFTDA